MAKLRIEAGHGAGKTVEFEKQAIVGRGETAQLQIGDSKASREHCKVFEQGGQWTVADLNSRNGLKVNGITTTRKTLSTGDRIEIGETVVVFELGAPATRVGGRPDAAKSDAAKPDPAPAKASAPAKSAPARAPAAAPRSEAGAKKDALMAQARADAATKKAPAPAKGGRTATEAPAGKGVEVSDRVLQFSRVDPKKATVLDIELGQSTAMVKLGITVACLAFLALLVWAVSLMV